MQTEKILHQCFSQTRKGIVLDVLEEGFILVQDTANKNATYACYFLRTAAGSPPVIAKDDEVIYRSPEFGDECGVVLGVIEKYTAIDPKVEKKLKKNNIKQMTTLEDGVLHIKAKDGLVIECGKSSIMLTREGKIQVKGDDVLSRSRGMNRIKGAGVNIN